MNKFIVAAVLYAMAGIVTFGYSYNADFEEGNQFIRSGEINSARALLCGMMWPLYWTVEGFKGVRPK